MRIGVLGEDNMHEAVLRGLQQAWCPHADIQPGVHRGKTGLSRKRELKAAFIELMMRLGCDCVVILLDADEDPWHVKRDNERSKLPADYRELTAIGAPERNIECWLSADPDDLASQTGCDAGEIRRVQSDDPKGVVGAAFKRKADQSGRPLYDLVEGFVHHAPRANWLSAQRCYKAFHNECRELATKLNCPSLPNDGDATTRTTSR